MLERAALSQDELEKVSGGASGEATKDVTVKFIASKDGKNSEITMTFTIELVDGILLPYKITDAVNAWCAANGYTFLVMFDTDKGIFVVY